MDMEKPTAERAQTAPLSAAFILMEKTFAEAVIERAIKRRAKATPNARKALNTAIRSGVEIKGFRDSTRASPMQLVPSVLYEIDQGNEKLAGAVLKVWDESQSALRGLVTELLAGKEMPVYDANVKRRRFEMSWSRDDWQEMRTAMLEQHADLNEDEVALMLCLASGQLPAPTDDADGMPLQSVRFERWLDELERLPSDAGEWHDAHIFADYVVDLAHHKIRDLISGHTTALEEATNALRGKFGEELRYLGIDLGAWFKEASVRLRVIPEAQELIAGLKDQLQRYRPLRPQAAVRDKEVQRASLRLQCEQDILSTVEQWQELMSCPPDPPLQPAEEVAEARAEYQTTTDSVNGELVDQQEMQALRTEVDRIRESHEQLQSEHARLQEAKEGVQLEKAQLSEQIGELKSQLAQSQQAENYWRQVYVEEKGRSGAQEVALGAMPSSVDEVIDHIGRVFPDEILFALNGKSRKNHPFQKPDELYQALAWLATEFHRLRPNPGASPDFDRMIKEACPGWSYKPNQTETTMGMYTEWYRTTVNGKTFDLANHIGKGNSHDPKNTIRIAFAWDEENKRIIVGFIGLHQRNRQS